MNIYDREVSIFILKHDGKGNILDSIDVSDDIISIGDKSWSVSGNELVKIQPPTLSFKLIDVDDYTYNWINTNLPSEDGVLRPFVNVIVDGLVYFTGLINLSQTDRTISAKEDYLTLNCQAWSTTLDTVDVSDQIKRTLPRHIGADVNRPEKTVEGISSYFYYLFCYEHGWGHNVNTFNIAYFPLDTDWLIVGDRVKDETTGNYYSVLKVWTGTYSWIDVETWTKHTEQKTCVLFTGLQWPEVTWSEGFTSVQRWVHHHTGGQNGDEWDSFDWVRVPNTEDHYSRQFTRQASNTEETVFLTSTEEVSSEANQYTLKVNTVNGVYPGDKLVHYTAAGKETTYEIRDINSETKQLIFTDAISETIYVGDLIGLDSESYESCLFESLNTIVGTACASIGCAADLSRFAPHTFSRPFLSWLPFKGEAGDIISAPYNLTNTLTGIRLRGSDNQVWTGTPEAGYTLSFAAEEKPCVTWTNQITTAPSSLIEENTTTYPTYTLKPNKPRRRFLLWDRSDRVDNYQPRGFFVYTYKSAGSTSTCLEAYIEGPVTTYRYWDWNGTAWVAGTFYANNKTSLAEYVPLCGVSFDKEYPGAYLLLQINGCLQLRSGATIVSTLAVPVELKNGTLVRTPYGAYLLGLMGSYAKIGWNGTQLTISSYVPKVTSSGVQRVKDFYFIETTFVALNENELYSLASVQVIRDFTATTQEIVSEVWLLKLDPNAAGPPTAAPEKVADGIYVNMRALKDPVNERIIGIVGGRLFQISKTITSTFERFKPSSSALELIEHCCTVQNAIAYPTAGMSFQIISRNLTEAALPVTFSIISDKETRIKDFYSVYTVKGSNELEWTWVAPNEGNDASIELSSIKRGGETFDLDCQDYVSTISECASLAADYADFFGKPRRGREIKVVNAGAGAANFETLKPLQRIVINDETSQWYVMGLTMNLDGKATLKLTEAL